MPHPKPTPDNPKPTQHGQQGQNPLVTQARRRPHFQIPPRVWLYLSHECKGCRPRLRRSRLNREYTEHRPGQTFRMPLGTDSTHAPHLVQPKTSPPKNKSNEWVGWGTNPTSPPPLHLLWSMYGNRYTCVPHEPLAQSACKGTNLAACAC
jgi:hypothetical protein